MDGARPQVSLSAGTVCEPPKYPDHFHTNFSRSVSQGLQKLLEGAVGCIVFLDSAAPATDHWPHVVKLFLFSKTHSKGNNFLHFKSYVTERFLNCGAGIYHIYANSARQNSPL